MSIVGPVQFSVGDQGPLKWRFAATNMRCCPVCSGKQIEVERIPEGCRMNGDAYGTTVFECKGCRWKTSFLWDDSSSDYYYEKPVVSGE